MGGNIGVTIREENGMEHRMSRWTNPIPWFINNIKLIEKDLEHLNEYLGRWYDMRQDWQQHQHDRQFEFNMTPVYAGHPYLAPVEYGLIVIDMQKNIILEYQGYAGIGKIYGAAIAYERDYGRSRYINGQMDTDRLRELFNAGRIKTAKEFIKVKQYEVNLSGKSFDQVVEFASDLTDFMIDMSPYEVIHYNDHNSNAAKRMLTKIKELGFQIIPQEENIWEQWIKDCSDYE